MSYLGGTVKMGGTPHPLAYYALEENGTAPQDAVGERHLLTPAGLRTLAPSDPRYRGRYEGGVSERDGAYHQGTVWPFLLGPFVTAWLILTSAVELAQFASLFQKPQPPVLWRVKPDWE